MKKLFWVNTLLLCSLLLVSCTTIFKNNDLIVDTALNLANKQVELNQLDEAIDTYDEALKHGYDYRLFYNKALVQSMLGYYSDAIETASKGYKLYKDKTDFVKLIGNIYYESNQIEDFINTYSKYFSLKPNDTNTKIDYMKKCFDINNNQLAYETAIDLWESGTNTKEVITVLYSINPDEWKIVNKLFN